MKVSYVEELAVIICFRRRIALCASYHVTYQE